MEKASPTQARSSTEIADLISKLFPDCVRIFRMQLPIMAVAVAVNGSVLAIRYRADSDGEDFTTDSVVDQPVGRGFVVPVNIMFSDLLGSVQRAQIDQRGAVITWFQ